jgi:M6 family metalloprotease-like protein
VTTPLRGKIFTFTQPDGSRFQVRGFGDQHHAAFETLDGYAVVKNPATGFFEIAQLSADGARLEPGAGPPANLDGRRTAVAPGLRIDRAAARARGAEGALRFGGRRCDERREQRRALARAARALGGPLLAPPQRPTTGDFVGLCLLIDFPDAPAAISRAEVDAFCNQPGYTGFGNNGSVFDYFNENSIGRCRYTNIVTEYYRAKRPKTYYTDPAVDIGVRARELIVEALASLKASNYDFTPLTPDGAGYVYAMNVYYAGEVVNNWNEGLWPHAWHLASRFPLAPGRDAHDYQFTAMGGELTLGTFCHENGHMLCDYPDLYDYGDESSGVGAFCLMCAGGNVDEKNPTSLCAYLKRLSGWARSVTAIGHDQQIELAAGQNDFALFARNASEYFLLESRRRSGRDAALPGEGLAIWHVDEDGDNSNEQRTPAMHYELSLEQADGLFQLERLRGQDGDAGDLHGTANNRFADSTAPDSRWWDGTASGLDVYQISASGPAALFRTRLMPDEHGARLIEGASAPGAAIPDNQAGGIIDTISIAQSGTIASATVTLDITHSYIGDLRVTLHTPWGDAIRLHERRGGSGDDIRRGFDESALPALATLRGRPTAGDWRLQVEDLAAADSGRLERWALAFTSAATPTEVVLEESPGSHIPDAAAAGIRRRLATAAAGTIGSVEVSVDVAHTYIGDLRVSLRPPAGGEVVLHDRAGGSADNLVKTYTAATSAGLAALAGRPIAGDWELGVADLAAADVGKLNHWKVVIRPA